MHADGRDPRDPRLRARIRRARRRAARRSRGDSGCRPSAAYAAEGSGASTLGKSCPSSPIVRPAGLRAEPARARGADRFASERSPAGARQTRASTGEGAPTPRAGPRRAPYRTLSKRSACVRVLGQLPRGLVLHEAVERAHPLPDLVERGARPRLGRGYRPRSPAGPRTRRRARPAARPGEPRHRGNARSSPACGSRGCRTRWRARCCSASRTPRARSIRHLPKPTSRSR